MRVLRDDEDIVSIVKHHRCGSTVSELGEMIIGFRYGTVLLYSLILILTRRGSLT